jgi:ubiquinone/menaquinone biosynthesis C-methylase UbiE
MTATAAPMMSQTPDFTAIKTRQQAMWATGDFSVVASRIVFAAEQLAEAADLQAGWRVLDVATGSGNAAIAAARRNCHVVGVDYVPALLERGRMRAEAEHLAVEFQHGDTEALPFEDGSFDAVLSIYGAMFAPNHRKAASELARVCKPGGRIALASWISDGFIGETFRATSKYMPPMPGLNPPIRWGDENYLKEIFGSAVRSITSQVRTMVFRYASPEENVEFFRRYFGPTIKAYEAANGREAELTGELIKLAGQYDRNQDSGPIAIEGKYLESIIVRA